MKGLWRNEGSGKRPRMCEHVGMCRKEISYRLHLNRQPSAILERPYEAPGLKATLIMPWRCNWADRAVPVLDKGRIAEETVKMLSLLKPHLLITLCFPILSLPLFSIADSFSLQETKLFTRQSGVRKATACPPASQRAFSVNHPPCLVISWAVTRAVSAFPASQGWQRL